LAVLQLAALHADKRVISEELLKATRRRSIARQRLVDARKALQDAEIEQAIADANVREAEQAERKELAL
jgi:hypothetical protein